ncbi:hypothetical protein D3C85_1339660 [compost metagenome]
MPIKPIPAIRCPITADMESTKVMSTTTAIINRGTAVLKAVKMATIVKTSTLIQAARNLSLRLPGKSVMQIINAPIPTPIPVVGQPIL